jgi:hypothetical protein
MAWIGFTPSAAQGAHHLVKISEVYVGSPTAIDVEWVELQLTAAGENQMTFGGGSSVSLFDAAGTLTASGTFASNPPNGQSQRTILAGTPSVFLNFGVTPDLELTPTADTSGSGGSACFNSVPFGPLDCVGWGNALPPFGPSSPFGTAAPAIPDGSSLVRSIAAGDPSVHEFGDDTDNSATDFAPDSTPTPCPNSAEQPACNGTSAPPPDADGDGVPDASDVCPGLAASTATGCPAIKRTLSLSYSEAREKFSGRLRPAGGCAAGQKVKILRKREGPDKRVTGATTKPTGRFSKVASVRNGSYYALVEPVDITDVGECSFAKSKAITIG